jgi:hypothetical protein
MEIKYSNPESIKLGKWQVKLVKDILEELPENSSVESVCDIERKAIGDRFILEVPDELSEDELDSVDKIVKDYLSSAVRI